MQIIENAVIPSAVRSAHTVILNAAEGEVKNLLVLCGLERPVMTALSVVAISDTKFG